MTDIPEDVVHKIKMALQFYGATGHETYQRFEDKLVLQDTGRRAREALAALDGYTAKDSE